MRDESACLSSIERETRLGDATVDRRAKMPSLENKQPVCSQEWDLWRGRGTHGHICSEVFRKEFESRHGRIEERAVGGAQFRLWESGISSQPTKLCVAGSFVGGSAPV